MENFTMHRISMAMYDYSYVTFKEVEQQILQATIAGVDDMDNITAKPATTDQEEEEQQVEGDEDVFHYE